MYGLLKNNVVVNMYETDVAEIHDAGGLLLTSFNEEYLEQIGLEQETLRAKEIAAQYTKVLCPRCVILNGEKAFGQPVEGSNGKQQ